MLMAISFVQAASATISKESGLPETPMSENVSVLDDLNAVETNLTTNPIVAAKSAQDAQRLASAGGISAEYADIVAQKLRGIAQVINDRNKSKLSKENSDCTFNGIDGNADSKCVMKKDGAISAEDKAFMDVGNAVLIIAQLPVMVAAIPSLFADLSAMNLLDPVLFQNNGEKPQLAVLPSMRPAMPAPMGALASEE